MTQTLQLIDHYFDTLNHEESPTDSSDQCLSTDILRVDNPMSEDSLDQLQLALESYEPDAPFELERRIADELVEIRHLIEEFAG